MREHMAFSYRDNLRRRPDFVIIGAEIPERLRRARPAWTDDPPVIPSPNPNDPFGDPPRPALELDPPERNPYNDPEYIPFPYHSPFIVTESRSGQGGNKPAGGVLGRLLAMMQQAKVQPGADSASTPNNAPEYDSNSYGSPQAGLLGRLLALQGEQAGNAVDVDAYGSYGPDRSRVARTYATAPQKIPTAPQKPVRILSRRPVSSCSKV
jgi:hypothetical protein